MMIDKIIEILSGYSSEKALDITSSRFRDILKRKGIKDNITKQLEITLADFDKAAKDEEYDFQGLSDTLKDFSTESFINTYAVASSNPDKLKKDKEHIYAVCIECTHAETKDAQEKVKHILNNCFSIVEESLTSGLSKDDWVQSGVINNYINENKQEIIDNSDKNTQTILNAINENKASQNLSSAQPEKKEIINDNESYLNTFSAKLFLENKKIDKAVVSLADIYISPSIQGEETTAAYCIKEWYNDEDAEPCFLLYGNAGVGKTSLVAKILADANGITEKDKVEFAFDSSKVMAVALRNQTDKINIQLKAEEILATLFNYDSAEQLKDKLLILDGLDELCVLKYGFEGKLFLEKLSRLGYGYHVLVTSRESGSYFTEPRDEEGLRTERLIWEEKQIKDWLDLYKAKKPRKEKWCIKFHEQLCSLETDDTRREIFCVPIILYICGTSETDIEDHSSIGSIYRDAFTKILLRKHLRGQSNTDEFKKADKEANMTAWQFTKELAYQMFLLDTLDLVDDNRSKDKHAVGFRNAQNRAKDVLKEEYKIAGPNLELKRELAVCPFARKNEKGGITFAHKTVYEYFTAVKLYEDYFAKFDDKYFNNNDNDTAAMDITESFIEAFRYDGIPDDIFSYLCKMNEEPFSTTLGYSMSTGLDYKKYEESFVYGMQKHIYALIGIKPAINEYLYFSDFKYDKEETNNSWKSKSIEAQTITSLSNFTWFLTGHGFRNKEQVTECKLISFFQPSSLPRSNHEGWHLEGIDLEEADLTQELMKGAHLEEANLEGAHLKGADLNQAFLEGARLYGADLTCAYLSRAHLEEAHLEEAHLEEAHLERAFLNGANLTSAYLSGADLSGADLTRAHLGGAYLIGALYCNAPEFKTIFPEGFYPKEHGMIEVDIEGNPVEDE